MNNEINHITVFEHETIRIDRGEKKISLDQYKALQLYYGEGIPYFKLINNGVQFNEYVGVIQIGKTLIEVLPKADNNSNTDTNKNKWRNILIDMMRAVGSFDIRTTSSSNLKIKPNTILDLYMEMFVKEVEYIMHNGLVKKYRKTEGNVTALKGSFLFSKHIQQNLIHQERFYVRYTNYDTTHQLHYILYKTILMLKHINTNTLLQSRIETLLLYFPEMPCIHVTEATFNKLVYNRKIEIYKKAIEIAKLLLLQYHPDVTNGRNNVLALMFDMNKLWEQFVFVSLRKFKTNKYIISPQSTTDFWKPQNGYVSKIRPDIVINDKTENCIVLDTKWKNLNGYNPSPEDLRQMFVYHEYFNSKKVALVYPSKDTLQKIKGKYLPTLKSSEKEIEKECCVISLPVDAKINEWQENIYKHIDDWINNFS